MIRILSSHLVHNSFHLRNIPDDKCSCILPWYYCSKHWHRTCGYFWHIRQCLQKQFIMNLWLYWSEEKHEKFMVGTYSGKQKYRRLRLKMATHQHFSIPIRSRTSWMSGNLFILSVYFYVHSNWLYKNWRRTNYRTSRNCTESLKLEGVAIFGNLKSLIKRRKS